MDNTEMFRKEVNTELCKAYNAEVAVEVMKVLDRVLHKYDVSIRNMALATSAQNLKSICEDYAADKLTNGLRREGVRNECYTINEFLKFVSLPLNSITAKDCREYIAQQLEKCKDTTVSTKAQRINRFFTWCVDEEYIERNPMKKIKVNHGESSRRMPLSDIEAVHMEESCKTKREKAVCEFLYSTGCRISELSKVKKEDINFSRRTIEIKGAKGGKNRTVVFNAKLEIALKEYFDSRKDDSEYVFVRERAPHGKMTPSSIRIEFENVIKRSEITRTITPHYMRHTFITNMLNRGAPINEVALLAGHVSVDTTSKVYAHISTKNLENTYNKYAG